MHRCLRPERGPEIDDVRRRSSRYEKVRKRLDDPKTLDAVTRLAQSRNAGIWRIKRAKIILNTLEGKSVDRMVIDTRVPPVSIIKCQRDLGERGMPYFDRPTRKPTQREARVENILTFLAKPPSPNSRLWNSLKVKYIGYQYSARQIMQIRELISIRPDLTRCGIASEICLKFGLYQGNGKLKITQTTESLIRMQMDNLIVLPAPANKTSSRRSKPMPKTIEPPPRKIILKAGDFDRIEIIAAKNHKEVTLWREMIVHHHYIGTSTMFGPQMRYLVFGYGSSLETAVKTAFGSLRKKRPPYGLYNRLLKDGRLLLGVIGFSSAAWRLASRESFIGWNDEQRTANLRLVVNNCRFLILPWIKSANLASKILGGISRRLPDDWQESYGYRPVLLETFVQMVRFKGTCYRAANWIPIGVTEGYSLYSSYRNRAAAKRIFVYPLEKKFRELLCRIS